MNLGLIYPRYPSPPSPHPPPPTPYNISLLHWCFAFGPRKFCPHMPASLYTVVLYAGACVVLLGPYYRPSSLDRWFPRGGEPYCAHPAGHS